ncbi:MAG: DUF1786 domain-containing protein, partial [Chloroflexi bacterium]|nr:DUF1786 domain-containing protein [Chloroflexota bacterium]
MQVLAIDIGTGTQDILLFDSEQEIENCPQMVVPSPTAIVAERIREATRQRRELVLLGANMGGGPSSWAVREHLRAGLPVLATPEAAQTIDDDMAVVREMGVTLVSEDEVDARPGAEVIVLGDYDEESIADALADFGVDLRPDAVAIAVLDHGNAPPGTSDRKFRFAYLEDTVRRDNSVAAFAYLREAIPPTMTRMLAVARSVPGSTPLLVMDTAAAAVLGCLEDPLVRRQPNLVCTNLGNSHTLAFHLVDGAIAGLFEHHTGRMTAAKLDGLLERLGRGELTNAEVFDDEGHGALVIDPSAEPPDFWAAIGPRRGLLRPSRLPVHMAVPHRVDSP